MKKGINNPGFRALPSSVQNNILSNMKYGGKRYSAGGAMPMEQLTEFSNGGTHEQNGLGGMLQTLYNSSPYQAINALYPEKFKPWEFSVKNYWTQETLQTARESTKWLIEEKLKLTPEEISKVKRKHFLDFNLGQMLRGFYQNSHLLALTDVYDF